MSVLSNRSRERGLGGSAGRPRRRQLLALLAAGALLGALAASGSSSSAAPRARSALATATVRIALDYTPNVDYLGIYAAKANGYFTQQGVDPQIIPYAETPAETLRKIQQYVAAGGKAIAVGR